jgi:hypothetical protein
VKSLSETEALKLKTALKTVITSEKKQRVKQIAQQLLARVEGILTDDL